MKKYSSKNNYFKFYNKEGTSCRIKIVPGAIDGQVTIKFKNISEHSWLYHVPDKAFKSQIEVLNFILKNLVSSEMIFQIIPTTYMKGIK